MDEEHYFTRTELKTKFDWTDKMVRYLPQPAKTKRSYYASQIVPVWSKEQVDQTFQLSEVQEIYARKMKNKEKRAQAAKKAVATKTQHLVDLIQQKGVFVQKVSRKKLIHRAKLSHEIFMVSHNFDDFEPFEVDDWKIVNTIRHDYTNYEELLELISSRVGKTTAFRIIADQVFPEILAVYPEYEETIMKQWQQHCERADFAENFQKSWFS